MIKGHVLLSRLRFLQEERGPELVELVLQGLSPEDRTQLVEPKRGKWYPFPTVLRLDRAIAGVLSPNDTAILERVGEAAARHCSECVGANSSLISVHSFLSRIVERHREVLSFGAAAYQRMGFTEGAVVLSEYPQVDGVWCRSAIGFLRECLRSFLLDEVRVVEVECQSRGDAACVFRLGWQGRPALASA